MTKFEITSFFHSYMYGDLTIAGERAANFDLRSARIAIEQCRLFSLQHLLLHGISGCLVHRQNKLTLDKIDLKNRKMFSSNLLFIQCTIFIPFLIFLILVIAQNCIVLKLNTEQHYIISTFSLK